MGGKSLWSKRSTPWYYFPVRHSALGNVTYLFCWRHSMRCLEHSRSKICLWHCLGVFKKQGPFRRHFQFTSIRRMPSLPQEHVILVSAITRGAIEELKQRIKTFLLGARGLQDAVV
eukprot:scaffold305363_cov18-Tisochrysis_lutea.AAC.1